MKHQTKQRHVLATPEQGRYPCLWLKKWESSGGDQDSHDTSSHDMFICDSSNSLINGSPTENGKMKLGIRITIIITAIQNGIHPVFFIHLSFVMQILVQNT